MHKTFAEFGDDRVKIQAEVTAVTTAAITSTTVTPRAANSLNEISSTGVNLLFSINTSSTRVPPHAIDPLCIVESDTEMEYWERTILKNGNRD